jgi:hypothetical protein
MRGHRGYSLTTIAFQGDGVGGQDDDRVAAAAIGPSLRAVLSFARGRHARVLTFPLAAAASATLRRLGGETERLGRARPHPA